MNRDFLPLAKEVLRIEAEALLNLTEHLDQNFNHAVQAFLACSGRIVVCGLGKSGWIGRKIAATLASTGTAAFFLHPTEALHGDLGMLKAGDVLLSLSYSGETDELLQILPYVKQLGLRHVTITGQSDSTLARHADWVLCSKVAREASTLTAAPMASTTASLALGDALAAALIEGRGFQQDDFARNHPGGLLGRRLLTKVETVMRKDNLPKCSPETSMAEVLLSMSQGQMGMILVCDAQDQVLGIITDGDLRRSLSKQPDGAFFQLQAKACMTLEPKRIEAHASLFEAEALMQKHRIQTLLVCGQEGQLLGLLARYML